MVWYMYLQEKWTVGEYIIPIKVVKANIPYTEDRHLEWKEENMAPYMCTPTEIKIKMNIISKHPCNEHTI